MSRSELEALADVWRTIRSSEYGRLEIDQMLKDDARAVMALFEPDERSDVSTILNDVRSWAMTAIEVDDEVDLSEQEQAEREPVIVAKSLKTRRQLEALGTAGLRDPSGPPSGSVTLVDRAGAKQRPNRTEAGSSDPELISAGSRGPVEGWSPATSRPAPSRGGLSLADDVPPWLLPAVVAMGLLAAVLWILVLTRGDSSDTAFVDETADPIVQTGLAPDLGTVDIGDFCAVAVSIDVREPVTELAAGEFGAEWFAANLASLRELVAVAPQSLSGDLATLVTHLERVEALGAGANFNRDDATLASALAGVDTTAAIAATDQLEAMTASTCG